jgi:hypothetical protein
MNNRIIQTVCIVTMLLGTSLTFGQTNPLLDNHRWQEYSYGVSILPPLGATVHKRSADQAIVRITAKEGYAINLFIKESTVEIGLDTVRDQALEKLAKNYPAATFLLDETNKINGRDALALHLFLPQTKQGPWVTAQTFVQISPQAFVLFQMETPRNLYDQAHRTFNAVINSMQLTDPKVLLAQREKLIDAGQALLTGMKFDELKHRLIPEQWFRFVDGDLDIGYMRILQSYGQLDNRQTVKPQTYVRFGYKVQVMARMELGEALYDSINTSYVADERDEEIWYICTTERPRDPRKVAQYRLKNGQQLKFDVQEVPVDNQNTWVETGVLSHDKIQLTRHDPSNDKQFDWDMPPKAYLTQVDLYLLPLMLKDQPNGQWGFYAYHANTGKISFRTERLEHLDNGHFKIYSRLTPEDIEEQVTEYDQQGKIVMRVLAGGRKLIPALRHQIENMWPQFVK